LARIHSRLAESAMLKPYSVFWIAWQSLPIVLNGDDFNPIQLHEVDESERTLQHFAQFSFRMLRQSPLFK
jgi:hypothetical protein